MSPRRPCLCQLLAVEMVCGVPSTLEPCGRKRVYGRNGQIMLRKSAVACTEEPFYSFAAASEFDRDGKPLCLPNLARTLTLSIEPADDTVLFCCPIVKPLDIDRILIRF